MLRRGFLVVISLLALSLVLPDALGQYDVAYHDPEGDTDYTNIDIVRLGATALNGSVGCYLDVKGHIEDGPAIFYYFYIRNITVVYSNSYAMIQEDSSTNNITCQVIIDRICFDLTLEFLNRTGISQGDFDIMAEAHALVNGTLYVDKGGKDHVAEEKGGFDQFLEFCGLGLLGGASCIIVSILFFFILVSAVYLFMRKRIRRIVLGEQTEEEREEPPRPPPPEPPFQ